MMSQDLAPVKASTGALVGQWWPAEWWQCHRHQPDAQLPLSGDPHSQAQSHGGCTGTNKKVSETGLKQLLTEALAFWLTAGKLVDDPQLLQGDTQLRNICLCPVIRHSASHTAPSTVPLKTELKARFHRTCRCLSQTADSSQACTSPQQ